MSREGGSVKAMDISVYDVAPGEVPTDQGGVFRKKRKERNKKKDVKKKEGKPKKRRKERRGGREKGGRVGRRRAGLI